MTLPDHERGSRSISAPIQGNGRVTGAGGTGWSGFTSAATRDEAAERRKVAALVPRFIEWFRAGARDLPWRRTRDPYAIWVSEIMLQQTQVATVIPYYQRWMRTLPDIRSLARASSQRLHKLWEGLGYYRRVRFMHAAAQTIVRDHDGQFPTAFEQVLALPGVGRYTAGAICSMAFNQPAPIVDGNVIRVLTRVFGIAGDPKDATVNARLWRLADALVNEAALNKSEDRSPKTEGSPEQPSTRTRTRTKDEEDSRACSHLNQALMELGATVCTPRNPACGQCPVAGQCVAWKQRAVEHFPQAAPRPVVTRRETRAFVITEAGRFLVVRNDADAVNGQLWEFPSIEAKELGPEAEDSLLRHPALRGAAVTRLGSFVHSITRYRIHLRAFLVELNGRTRSPQPIPRRVQTAGAQTFLSARRSRHDGAQTFLSALANRPLTKPTRMSARRYKVDGSAKWVSRATLRRLPLPAAHRRIERMLAC